MYTSLQFLLLNFCKHRSASATCPQQISSWSGPKPESPRWEAGDELSETWHSQHLVSRLKMSAVVPPLSRTPSRSEFGGQPELPSVGLLVTSQACLILGQEPRRGCACFSVSVPWRRRMWRVSLLQTRGVSLSNLAP